METKNYAKETRMINTIVSTAALVLFGFAQADADYVRVAPHQRTSPDRSPYNNYDFPGNYNPNSGQATPGNPDTYLDRYNNHDLGRSSGGFGNTDPFNSRRR